MLISAIIITKNEEKNIRRCLRSLHDWIDEIVIIDSGSTDNTLKICREYTQRVFSMDWPGFGPQKNRALNLAQGTWVLSLDADEWVSLALKKEILQAIPNLDYHGYRMPRRNMFCGRFQRFGDAAKDKVLRIFQKQFGQFTEDLVHEKVICDGTIGLLKNPLLHNSSRTEPEWRAQMEKYAKLAAQLRYHQGKRSTFFKAVVNSGWIFFRSYCLRMGFLDGKIGFLFAKLNAKYSFQKNIEIRRLRRIKS
ncbi:MAG: glycosyltransferase family 2 protein [Proteobacteria bacterium]|nr:glycosyltransferase family 2 protein [Pseudomonadota bacterium]